MRFSSLFQHARPQPGKERVEPPRAPEQPPPAVTATPVLPDDLDARVRLVGEWQLDEGWA